MEEELLDSYAQSIFPRAEAGRLEGGSRCVSNPFALPRELDQLDLRMSFDGRTTGCIKKLQGVAEQ